MRDCFTGFIPFFIFKESPREHKHLMSPGVFCVWAKWLVGLLHPLWWCQRGLGWKRRDIFIVAEPGGISLHLYAAGCPSNAWSKQMIL